MAILTVANKKVFVGVCVCVCVCVCTGTVCVRALACNMAYIVYNTMDTITNVQGYCIPVYLFDFDIQHIPVVMREYRDIVHRFKDIMCYVESVHG